MLALALSTCGGSDPEPIRLEPEGGDEQPIEVVVDVELTGSDTSLSPRRVAAFLPLRFVVSSDVGGRVRVAGVGARQVTASGTVELRSPGLQEGRVRVSGPGGTAFLRVRPGG